MRVFGSWAAFPAALFLPFLTACAGGGAAAHAGALPAHPQGVANGAAAAKGATRRAQSIPTCSGTGPGSFIGANNSNAAGGTDSVVVGGSGNQACSDDSSILGGQSNAISGTGVMGESVIAGGYGNVITGTTDGFNAAIVTGYYNTLTNAVWGFIGGGSQNQISANASAIGGGESNSVSGDHSFLGSGSSNAIKAGSSAIGGGANNTVSAPYGFIGSGAADTVSGEYGFIGSGTNNTVSGEGGYIASGGYNTVTGEGAVVDGGYDSKAAGAFATIPGGYGDSAGGTYSFAAGARASAGQTGTFVWSDGSDGDATLSSSRAYQFLARASGGFILYTNPGSTVGAQLPAGSGTWASLSDRNAKTNIVPLDDASVLRKVASLPISRWSYRTEHGVRHVGPMAQDFYAAFKVGEDDRHITPIDEDGVALAAVKALYRDDETLRLDNRALNGRIEALDVQNARLRSALADSESAQSREIAALREQIESLTSSVARMRER